MVENARRRRTICSGEQTFLRNAGEDEQLLMSADAEKSPDAKNGRMAAKSFQRRGTASCISKIMPPGTSSEIIGETRPQIREWPLSTGEGVLECGNSMLAALYVLDWISMQECFQPELDEHVARMSIAMKVMLSSTNELGPEMKTLANKAVLRLKG
ncbi:hypothetical protein RIF29_00270 [Crotalaria pallida]|uniref:Uncharacterized protein n=1 Tax=Crotalaria pallida TaxID=3830 RepID=A0AAN9IVI1_CROPI